jgi:uncharacterized caspase-like protein
MASQIQIHAVIVGINDYPVHGSLSSAVKDATAFSKVVQQLNKPGQNVILTDAQATKEEILESIKKVAMNAKRDDAFVFFFSGYAAQTTVDNVQAGIICPHDVDVDGVGGISDVDLLQAFDNVSRSRGNNIVNHFV